MRAVVLLSAVMIATMAISAALALFDLRQKELAHSQGEAVSLSMLLSEQTTRAFDGIILMMRGVRDRLDEPYGRGLTLDSLPVRLLLKVRSAGLPQVKSVFLIDRDGFGVNSSRDDFIRLLPMRDREFFRYFAEGGQDEVFISRPEKARVDGQWTYYVSVAFSDSHGRFRGVLVAAVNVDYFESLYGSIGLDAVSQIVLLNEHGELAAGQFRDNEKIGAPFADKKILATLKGMPGKSAIETRTDAAGRKRFVAYRAVANYPFFIGASADEEEALAPWREIVHPVVVGVVLVILFVLITTVVLVRNLARKEMLELALIDSGEQLRHMIESARDAIVTLDSFGRVSMFNRAAASLFGISATQASGRSLVDLLEGKIPEEQLGHLANCLLERNQVCGGECIEAINLSRDGRDLLVEVSWSAAEFRGEILLTAVFRDATERRRADQQLRESNRQLHELSAALQAVREDERTRIARELHDELGQLLTGIRLEISWLGGRLNPDQQALSDRISAVKAQIDQTVMSIRRISSELRPLVLDDLGLVAAMHWYLDQFSERTGVRVERDLPESDPVRGSSVATALFRILQESMTNIARHAEASWVRVCLSRGNDHWALSVTDDGKGFAFDASQCCDIGLIGMRERAQMLGGSFVVESSPGNGTQVRVVIPQESRQRESDGEA